jgi:hypothetical protein
MRMLVVTHYCALLKCPSNASDIVLLFGMTLGAMTLSMTWWDTLRDFGQNEVNESTRQL